MMEEQMTEAPPLPQRLVSIRGEEMPNLLACHMVGDAEDIAWEVSGGKTFAAEGETSSIYEADCEMATEVAERTQLKLDEHNSAKISAAEDESRETGAIEAGTAGEPEKSLSTGDPLAEDPPALVSALFLEASAMPNKIARQTLDAVFPCEGETASEPGGFSLAACLSSSEPFTDGLAEGFAREFGSASAYAVLAGSLGAPWPVADPMESWTHSPGQAQFDPAESVPLEASSSQAGGLDAPLEADLQDEAEGWHLPDPEISRAAAGTVFDLDALVEDDAGPQSAGAGTDAAHQGRQHERYPVDGDAEVTVTASGQSSLLLRGRILDISPSGCFIQTLARTVIQPGTKVDILFGVARQIFRVKAESRFAKSAIGIGFRFLPMNESTQARLGTALDRVASALAKEQEAEEAKREKLRVAAEPLPLEEYVADAPVAPAAPVRRSGLRLVEGEVVKATDASSQPEREAGDPPLAWNPFEIGRRFSN